ncbi:hypothetical protein IV203_025852 [Nitzschia inconspicua]|uniref:Uncharacterized protein n=1 Tax=Nitzschia inconspicua TaxID=303405 RepID=A0A9K3PWQ4_9STRA|nr:hypothetical protein IV203_025852 [Nitzschia inconspicua]
MKTPYIALFCLTVFIRETMSIRPWGSAKSVNSEIRQEEISNHQKWSSYVTVDATKLVSYLVNHGGLVLPKSTKEEIKVFGRVCHVDEILLNVMQRRLQVRNFTIHTEGDHEDVALRIGRLYVEWSSYRKPCLSIEVDDVDILVEFLNIVLSRNNWNNLKDSGFPPSMYTDEVDPVPTTEETNVQDSFVRIESVDFSGNITCTFRSKPLKKEIAVLQFDLDSFDEVDRQIRERSDDNLIQTGRKGCTTDELYDIVKSFFARKIKEMAASNVEDALNGREMSTLQGIKRAWSSTSNSATGYVDDARDWTEGKLRGKLSESIQIGKQKTEKVTKNPFIQAALRELQKASENAARSDANDEDAR